MNNKWPITVIIIITLIFFVYLSLPEENQGKSSLDIHAMDHMIYQGYDSSEIRSLPRRHKEPMAKVSLGDRLFHDNRLSRDNSISCSSCHDLRRGGTDRQRISTGIEGQKGQINAPTVFNSKFNFRQFWDGRAETLEAQASGPIHNPIEMGSSWELIIEKLNFDKDYTERFKLIYPDGITPENITDAIVSFERTLITPDSRFDQFLIGNQSMLSEDEKEGFKRFREYGCVSCHQGVNLGGNLFQRFGAMRGYFNDKEINKGDLGRFNVTGRKEDHHVFKVPSLRNVAVTSPYLHDGSINSLREVVAIMGRYQLGKDLSADDLNKIVAFLGSLTGKYNGEFLR